MSRCQCAPAGRSVAFRHRETSLSREQRRLAAIDAADVVGYSRLTICLCCHAFAR